ncbi:MAG: helix-turn-helix transcriptional regulator, partial [Thiohalomonadales bacterium]
LATALEVSVRTIYRDIQDLISSGVPIEGEAGIGYILRKGFDLPPLMFTKQELSALILGARLVNSCSDSKLAAAANQALTKIEVVLPDRLKLEENENYMFSPFSRISAEVSLILGDVRQAIEQRQKIFFDYTRSDENESSRTVWPLGLFFWGSVWTLAAWCELRQAFRNFRLDRMERIVTQDSYPNKVGFTLTDYMRSIRDYNT